MYKWYVCDHLDFVQRQVFDMLSFKYEMSKKLIFAYSWS